jgi:hypothetical protein
MKPSCEVIAGILPFVQTNINDPPRFIHRRRKIGTGEVGLAEDPRKGLKFSITSEIPTKIFPSPKAARKNQII